MFSLFFGCAFLLGGKSLGPLRLTLPISETPLHLWPKTKIEKLKLNFIFKFYNLFFFKKKGRAGD